jgi:endoglucanase
MQIKKIILGLTLIVMGAFASPISVNGQLSVSGFNIVNQSGNPFILRGMSLFWDNWGFESFFNTNVINTLASSSWGSNVVRVPIHNLDESRAKSMIDAANNAGIYVIVDYHSHCAHRNASGAKTFFWKYFELR